MKILVICHGNINRSPLVTAVLKTFPGLEVRSAAILQYKGIRTLPRATKKMREAAWARGYDLADHRATPLNPVLIDWADKIIYMDERNYRGLVQYIGDYLETIQKKFLKISPEGIPDPAWLKTGSPEFENVVDDIIAKAKKLGEELCLYK